MTRIVSILPKGEGFSPQQFGAIALCVRDFTLHSRWHTNITVIGGVTREGFPGIHYAIPPAARWFENRTRTYAKGCADIIIHEKADLAEIHNRPVLVRLIARKTSCKVALHLHNDPQEMQEARTPKQRLKLLALCSAIYCVSNYIRDRFMEGLPLDCAKKVHVVYNGIEIPGAVEKKAHTIVYVGRMTEGKGAMLLAQALSLALPKLPHWRAVMIGSRRHEAGQKLTPHEQQIAKTLLPLGQQALLAGFLTHAQVLAHFAQAEIAVVPSVWHEPFGRTAIEAMAYGCAVISSGRGGLREVTADAALTLSELSPQTLADAIILLATQETKRQEFQAAAKVQAAHFNIASCTKKLDDIRDSIVRLEPRHGA